LERTTVPVRLETLKTLDARLTERLLRFARSHYGADWLDEAVDAYLGVERDDLPDAELGLAIPWVLHILANEEDDRTVAEAWRERQGSRLSSDMSVLLDAYDVTWLSIWEVREVERGLGFRAVDVLTGAERFVSDVSASSTVNRFDTLLAMILDFDGGSFFGGAHGNLLPPREADSAIREARRLCGVRTRAIDPATLRDPNIQLGLTFIWDLEVEGMLLRPPPELHNTDGDLLVLTRDEFDLLRPRDEVAHTLASLDGAGEAEADQGELVFAISKPGNAMHRSWDNTIVGRIGVSERSLSIETNSTRRADELRASVERHLGSAIRFRERVERGIDELMEELSDGGQALEPLAPADIPPEAAEIERAMREEHMRDWVDDSIPALGGLTPRAAAKSKAGRRKLELLLKEIEYDEATLAPEQRIDIERLRAELGMPAE
jgi:hypothetical protein